ncbi:MAG TPA: glycoside hydrolase family 13 protein [Bacteroidota bacterium]|nr:glycoside hydrolase family 13 protein [Bacteroidota bacterium]
MKLQALFVISAFSFFALAAAPRSSKEIPRVPQWAKTAIWYQIFPERFANGDTANDPTPLSMKGAWPYRTSDGWNVTPWTSDWYKLQPWEKANGHDFYWNAGTRRYGGDIQGIIDHLDYLQDLGITAIYLNPIFEAPSSHKYDTRMYHHVDDNFGPDPTGDEKIIATENPNDPTTWKWTSADKLFLQLIRDVHRRGMKIILDGVFNHVGTSFWAFQDVVKNQEKSAYKDWFKIRSWDNPNTPENEFEYEGWAGVKDLPEINKNGKYDMADGFADHVHAILRRWMDPNGDGDPSDGIDGWRLDVAEKISLKFWRIFRVWVKEINPEAYITGEIWWQNWQINQMFNAAPWLQGDAFDGVMNYRFARALKKYVVDVDSQISSSAFVDSIAALGKEYDRDNLYAVQNLLDSHDVDRIASQLVNPDRWYDHYANPGQNKKYKVRKPTDVERLKQKMIVGIQMTMPGAPMIYYGDEAGMWGGDDPDCRKPMVWPRMHYETEISDPLGRKREPDSVFFNDDIFHWYKKLIELRKGNTALSEGDLKFILVNDKDNVIGYSRTLDGSSVVIIVNNSAQKRESTIHLALGSPENSSLINLIDGVKIHGNGMSFAIELRPYEIKILRPE